MGGGVTTLIAIRAASLRRECRENSDFSLFDLSDRAPSPTKKKEEEKNKLRGKEKSGGAKEVADKARGREKTRTRASSGSSRSEDAVMLHVCIFTSYARCFTASTSSTVGWTFPTICSH